MPVNESGSRFVASERECPAEKIDKPIQIRANQFVRMWIHGLSECVGVRLELLPRIYIVVNPFPIGVHAP